MDCHSLENIAGALALAVGIPLTVFALALMAKWSR